MTITIRSRADDAEKHEYDVTSLVFHNGKLYSAADDGKIKLWEEDLKFVRQVHAHPCSIFALAVGKDAIYSCSNDGSVKAWALESLQPKGTILEEECEIWKVCFNEGKLYVGDNEGRVKIYENNNIVGILEVMHPITDLLALGNVVYSARDLYVIISEIYPEQKKITTLKALEGRTPICFVGGKLCFSDRSGRDLLAFENSKKSDFKELGRVKGAHELIISAICGSSCGDFLYSGGWDKVVKKWKVGDGSSMENVDKCDVEINITAMTVGPSGKIYVGGGDGHVLCLNDQ